MIINSYSAECAWPARAVSIDRIGDDFLRAVRAISATDPTVVNWRLFEPEDPTGPGLPIAEIAGEFTRFVESEGERDEEDGLRLIANCQLGPATRGEDRTALSARSGCLLVVNGSVWRNCATFSMGSKYWPPNPSAAIYPLFRGALLTMLDVWRPPWACVRSLGQTGNTAADCGDPTFPYSYFQVPWMGYLDAARAAAVTIPPDLMTERAPDGGLLMIAAQVRPDFVDPAQLRAAKQIATIMINHVPKDDPMV